VSAVAYDGHQGDQGFDAVFVHCDVVRQAAMAAADREGLAEGRLNDAVKGFVPDSDPDVRRFSQAIR
jgi:hypothetical protein